MARDGTMEIDRAIKALSLILSYPTPELQAAAPEIAAAIAADGRFGEARRSALAALLEGFARADIYELQETYVGLFDRSRSLSLNLFEHVHGESRDRGGAMVSLVETYREAGFDPVSWELPDHLPVLLEFLATQPFAQARETLADAAHIFAALSERLARRESPYAAVFDALLELSGERPDAGAVAELLQLPEDDPDDLEALDRTWEEAEVVFGPDPEAGCPAAREVLARMEAPAHPAPTPAPGAPARAAE